MIRWYFGFFVVSGFCSILYEVIWLRLAMAQFGVTTPLVSLVLSIFMIGLGLGSWGSGRLVENWRERLRFPPLRLYALTELLIGVSAIAVPFELSWGHQLLEGLESAHGLSSSGYYVLAGGWIALTLVPWCACMGATFPCAMFAIEESCHSESKNSFSYLYLANVLGAMTGAVLPLFLIEEVGFRTTLEVGSILNLVLATSAFTLTLGRNAREARQSRPNRSQASQSFFLLGSEKAKLLWLLFGTGLTSMGAEVVWVRMFTPALGTVVYAFAAILALYLGATYAGSWFYRRRLNRDQWKGSLLWVVVGFVALIPLVTADARIAFPALLRVVFGVVPFSAVLGFVTPLILDRTSGGDPGRAGTAYAVNVIGCIIGPLLSGFLLLPLLGERMSLCLLALPWFLAGVLLKKSPLSSRPIVSGARTFGNACALIVLSVALVLATKGFEEQFPRREVRRDYTATVVATGSVRETKRLLVNGVGITNMTPVTKMMAHLPLAFLGRQPTGGLVICFGMGTTHRSVLSWGISSTAVELVPSVPLLYGYFHADGPKLLQSPWSHLVIDDGRFYLERSKEQFDIITIDPPPPVEAAGSSLLYSKEFYVLAKRHLRKDGILQQWLPNGDAAVHASVARALKESFSYVRVFGSVEGWGHHFLASMSPIPTVSADVLVGRMPLAAVADLLEWGPYSTATQQFAKVLSREVSLDGLIEAAPGTPAIQDDHPINEYFIIRQLRDPEYRLKAWQHLVAKGG